MVMEPTDMTTAKGDPAQTGENAPAESSKVNASTPGLVKTSKFKKRRVLVKRAKNAAAVAAALKASSDGAGTADGGSALAAKASPPVVEAPKPDGEGSVPTPVPATDGDGSVSTPVPANAKASAAAAEENPADTNAKASASEAKQNPADTDAKASELSEKQNLADTEAGAAAASSKGKSVIADSSGGDRKMKGRKQRAKERAMNSKGKEMEYNEGRKGKGSKAVVKKVGMRENKGAGFIFMCNKQTKQECYQHRLFGMPNGKFGMVKKIKPGAKLFLYDFDLKLLYGVYKAASNGRLNLVPEAFNGKFPAQVKFNIDRDCIPLSESSFKHAIKENYNSSSKFHPELSSKQVQRLIALFKPANVPRPVPNNRLDERRRNGEQKKPYHSKGDERRHRGERRQPYHFDERRSSLSIEEVRQPRFDERRPPAVMHVPVEDTYMAPRFAPLPVESRLGRSLANVQDEHHTYYEPVHLAPEPRRVPLAVDSRHDPLVLERQYVRSLPDPRHVPSVNYRTSIPSDDSYYQPASDLGPERFADRTMAERTARDPIVIRDHSTLSAHPERMELYGTGGTRGVHVEEHYNPRELGIRADRSGISTRGDHLAELYRSEQLGARAVDFPRRSTYTDAAYAETSQRYYYPAMASASGPPVPSVYSYSDGPVYR